MFTGIINNIYKVSFKNGSRLGILSKSTKDKPGDSIAVDGVCLTVTQKRRKTNHAHLLFDLSNETLNRTNLSQLKLGQHVNVERPLRLSDFLGGHIVQGHVDGVGKIIKITKSNKNWVFWFSFPKSIRPCLVPKGSVAVNGISLTVASLKKNQFSVEVIPYTFAHTTFKWSKVNDEVNLEGDVMAKYISKYIRKR